MIWTFSRPLADRVFTLFVYLASFWYCFWWVVLGTRFLTHLSNDHFWAKRLSFCCLHRLFCSLNCCFNVVRFHLFGDSQYFLGIIRKFLACVVILALSGHYCRFMILVHFLWVFFFLFWLERWNLVSLCVRHKRCGVVIQSLLTFWARLKLAS